jgi:hypothetical protein
MNQEKRITGRPRRRNVDTHTHAVAQAYTNGLAAWALANGYIAPDGSPLIHSASQRRLVKRARNRSKK